ncbi:MAG: hypothetical protein NTY38_07355, partial [Acidobacteria bacterium]|nr:hypothetical protein [Acidobacteriota bacterium]
AQTSRVIFLDASADVEPGEIRLKPIEPASAKRPFEHHATPAAILRLAADCYGWQGEAVLIAIGCEQFELSEELSEAARRGVARAVEATCASWCPRPFVAPD